MPWSDFGLGLDDDARKNAMRQALVDAGIAIMAGAPTQGFGAFSALGPALADSYRKNVYGAHDLRRQQDLDEQNEAYRQERLESLRQTQEDRLERRGDRDATREAEAAEMETRRRAIAEVQDPKVRGELQLRVGQSNFWDVYDKKTAPPKEDDRAPTTREFPDGSLRQWDPTSKSWSVLARDEDSGEEGGLLDSSTRRRLTGELNSMEAAKKAALKRADAEIARVRKENEPIEQARRDWIAGGKEGKEPPPPKAVPDRLELAKRYETEELGAARYVHGVQPPSSTPTAKPPRIAQEPRSLPGVGPTTPAPQMPVATPAPPAATPAEAPAQPGPQATPEQAQRLAALIEQRVGAYGKPPTEAMALKAQILARAREALAKGVPAEQILQELQGPQ